MSMQPRKGPRLCNNTLLYAVIAYKKAEEGKEKEEAKEKLLALMVRADGYQKRQIKRILRK